MKYYLINVLQYRHYSNIQISAGLSTAAMIRAARTTSPITPGGVLVQLQPAIINCICTSPIVHTIPTVKKHLINFLQYRHYTLVAMSQDCLRRSQRKTHKRLDGAFQESGEAIRVLEGFSAMFWLAHGFILCATNNKSLNHKPIRVVASILPSMCQLVLGGCHVVFGLERSCGCC